MMTNSNKALRPPFLTLPQVAAWILLRDEELVFRMPDTATLATVQRHYQDHQNAEQEQVAFEKAKSTDISHEILDKIQNFDDFACKYYNSMIKGSSDEDLSEIQLWIKHDATSERLKYFNFLNSKGDLLVCEELTSCISNIINALCDGRLSATGYTNRKGNPQEIPPSGFSKHWIFDRDFPPRGLVTCIAPADACGASHLPRNSDPDVIRWTDIMVPTGQVFDLWPAADGKVTIAESPQTPNAETAKPFDDSIERRPVGRPRAKDTSLLIFNQRRERGVPLAENKKMEAEAILEKWPSGKGEPNPPTVKTIAESHIAKAYDKYSAQQNTR